MYLAPRLLHLLQQVLSILLSLALSIFSMASSGLHRPQTVKSVLPLPEPVRIAIISFRVIIQSFQLCNNRANICGVALSIAIPCPNPIPFAYPPTGPQCYCFSLQAQWHRNSPLEAENRYAHRANGRDLPLWNAGAACR